VKKVPLVDVLWAVVDEATRKAQEAEINEFFELVAQQSDKEDVIGLVVDVAEGMDKPHVHRAVVNGYAKMRQCIHEAAKPCLAVLVAQEMHDHAPPTAYFRQCAALLADCDSDVLSTLKLIADVYVGELDRYGDGFKRRILASCDRVLDDHAGRTFWVTLRADGDEQHSDILDQPAGWREALAKLDRYGFGRGIKGVTSVMVRPETQGKLAMDWTEKHDPWIRGLHRCLQALDV